MGEKLANMFRILSLYIFTALINYGDCQLLQEDVIQSHDVGMVDFLQSTGTISIVKREIPQQPLCPCNNTDDYCGQFTGDPCSCVDRQCDYLTGSGNKCVADQTECQDNHFWPGECRRIDAFYSVGGYLCRNLIEEGDCEPDLEARSNFAVNLNGYDYTDINNIHYLAQNATQVKPNYHVTYKNASDFRTSICKKSGRGDEVDISSYRQFDLNSKDWPNLFFTYVEGKQTHGASSGEPCLTFPIRFVEDGVYELNIKSAETEYFRSGVRHFNVKIDNITVFPMVDIIRLVGRPCKAIDLLSNFVVRRNQSEVIFRGFKKMNVNIDRTIELQFCMASCSTNEGHGQRDNNFVASTFAVTKLKNAGLFSG